MSRNRIIYNTQDVFVGPSDESLVKFWGDGNYLKRLSRIQDFSYGITKPMVEVKELGREESSSFFLSPPTVDFRFTYLNAGITNDYNLGFNVNYSYFFPAVGRVDEFYNLIGANFVSGMFDPTRKFDRRNFYLVINNSTSDLRTTYERTRLIESSGIDGIRDPLSSGYCVMAFVNAYLASYETNASVGEFPSTSVSYTADSVAVFASGSGVKVPRVNLSNGQLEDTKYDIFIPRLYADNTPSVLRPGDITLDLNGNNINDIGVKVSDLKINAFKFSFQINREPFQHLGDFWYEDNPPKTPCYYFLAFDAVVGDMQAGSFADLLRKGEKYNINVSIRCPTGTFTQSNYQFKNVEFESLSANSSIGANNSIVLNFVGQMISSSLSTGVFISGIGLEFDSYYDSYVTMNNEAFQTVSAEAFAANQLLMNRLAF